MYEFSSKPINFTRIFSSQNLPTLRAPSVPKTCQLYVYLPSPTPINFTCTFRLQHLSILHVPPVSNTYQFYMYLPYPTSINFTHIFRLQHPEPMPRLPLVRQPYAGALSKDEIQHLRRLSRGSADPREHSRSQCLA